MNALYVLPLVFAAVSAGYAGLPLAGGYARTVVAAPAYAKTVVAAPAVASTQYHAQDGYGYNYGYNDLNSAKAEAKSADGVVQGSYSYVAPNGQLIKNDYIADANGFRSSLAPTAPKDFALPAVGYAKAYVAAAPYAVAPAATVVKTLAAPAVVAAPAYAAGYAAPGFAYRTNTVGYGAPAVVKSYIGAPALAHGIY